MAISTKTSTPEELEIPYFNPLSGPYLVRMIRTNKKEKLYLPLKVG